MFFSAFSIDCDGCPTQSYCGYPPSNTGYRLAIALITFFLAVAMALKFFDDKKEILYFVLLINGLFWAAAFVVDCATLTNSTLACSQGDFSSGDYNCHNATYGEERIFCRIYQSLNCFFYSGISIAVDISVTFVAFLAWITISVLDGSGPLRRASEAPARSGSVSQSMANPVAPVAVTGTTPSWASAIEN